MAWQEAGRALEQGEAQVINLWACDLVLSNRRVAEQYQH